MSLKLIGIGTFGGMLSPSALHLKGSDTAHYLRVLDRRKFDTSPARSQIKNNWRSHGAAFAENYEELIGDGEFDGVVICAGKNGDDHKIFKLLLPLLATFNKPYFILHLSTVSPEFVVNTHEYCKSLNINYANYPLTGGVAGAQAAKMLILASGDEILFNTVQAMLAKIGEPKFLGKEIERGAEVKLIGQLMVFNNLIGISSAVALHTRILKLDHFQAEQLEFFDFLNKGAGGSRQWEVALRTCLETNDFTKGFLLKHAAVDILYAAQLMLHKQMPHYTIIPLLQLALAFSFLLQDSKHEYATAAIIKTLLEPQSNEIDKFIHAQVVYNNVQKTMTNCVNSFPENIKKSIMLEVHYDAPTKN